MRAKKYVRFVMIVTCLGVAIVAGFNIYADPYWLWQEKPVWIEGRNPVLSRKMRFAKALQVIRRQPEVVVIGSSRVQVGIDPAVTNVNMYNLGIESLRSFEMRAYVEHILRWTAAEHIIIGLDFLAFLEPSPDQPFRAGFAPDLGSYQFLVNGFSIALFSRTALEDSRSALRGGRSAGGAWSASGYMRIQQRPQGFIERLADYMAENTYTPTYSDHTLTRLEDIILSTQRQGVNLTLFVTPVHQEQFEVMARAGQLEHYQSWREKVIALAQEHSVTLWDFTQNNPYMNSDLSQGSNDYYLDRSHYTPYLGLMMMKQLGMPLQRKQTLPEIGLRVSPASATMD